MHRSVQAECNSRLVCFTVPVNSMQKANVPAPRTTPRLMALVLTACLTGCAANPYSTATLPKPATAIQRDASVRLVDALDYLHVLRDDYRTKRSAEFDRQQALTTGLFGMGALAIGLGAYHAHPDAIKGVALGGATAYQIGKWNTDAGRTALYGEGIASLTCAESVMTPVLVAADRYRTVAAALSAVRAQQAVAMRAHSAVLAMITSTTLTAETQAAYGLTIAAADKEMRRAVRAINRAQAWNTYVENSGNVLNDQVEQVRNAVDLALSGRVPELDKLMESVNALANYATFFATPAAEGGAAVATTLRQPQQGITSQAEAVVRGLPGGVSIGALVEATGDLALAVDQLIDSQPKIDTGATQSRLAGCNIGNNLGAVALQIEPAEIEATAGEARNIMVDIKGPDGVYATAFEGDATAGITVTPPRSRVFTVKIGAASLPGTYLVRVQGENKATTTLKMQLLAKPVVKDPPPVAKKAPASKPAPAPAPAPSTAAAQPPAPGALCVHVTNPASCMIKDAICDLECRMGPAELSKLRGIIGLPGLPAAFDRDFRIKLAAMQKHLNLLPQNGEYNDDTARALHNRTSP